jgi:DNA-binding transcriptional LysR family regulator
MDLQLGPLRTLHAVARFGSFSRAAGHLHLTQPAVSMQVRQLEDGLGVRLLERAGRRVRPSAAGRLLLEHAERALGELTRAVERLHALHGVVAGAVRLGTGTAISMYLLPPLLSTLRTRHPSVELTVTTGTAPEITRAIAEGDLDLGVVSLPVRRRELVVTPFVTDELVAIAKRGHWRAGGPLDAAGLGGERLILDQPGAMSRRLVDEWFRRHGGVPAPLTELGNTEAGKELVSVGLGVAIATWLSVRREVATGRLACRRLSPALWYPLGIVHRRERAPVASFDAVLSALGTVRRSLQRRFALTRRRRRS